MNNKELNEWIKKDSMNQRWYNEHYINRETYEKNKAKIHDEYLKLCKEQELIKTLMKKYGGK